MAGFYLISCDSPLERRRRVEWAKSFLSPIPCSFHEEEFGNVCIVLALLPHTPFSRHESADGTLSVVLGRPIDADGVLHAEDVSEDLRGNHVPAWSGLFVWFSLQRDGSLRIGNDAFSLFPVFFSQQPGMLEAASSPAAIHSQLGFSREIDPVGLARYLMGNGSSGRRTLHCGIHRMEGRSRLAVSSGREVLSIAVPEITGTGVALPATFQEGCEEANAIMEATILRHGMMDGETPDLLLSGGLDSRLVLAHLVKLGMRPRCLTRGCDGDDEVVFARKVARKADCSWLLVKEDLSRALSAAKADARLCSLSAGFSNIFYMWDVMDGQKRAPQTFNGFFLDMIMDPFAGIADPQAPREFDEEFHRKMNSFGIHPRQLKQMLGGGHALQAVDEALVEMREEWESFSPDPRTRILQTAYHFRVNHHIGSVVWKNSFISWPVFPALDLQLFRRFMEYPVEWFIGRKLEREMLVHINPVLAKIPLDGNSKWPKPIIDTFSSRMALKGRKWRAKHLPKQTTPLRYFRLLDINGDAWTDIRKESDALRGSLAGLFDEERLDEYFPCFGRPVPKHKDAIQEHAGRRLIAGLALTLGQG